MKFTASREQILGPLSSVMGAIQGKHTMAILSDVLLRADNGWLEFTGTDGEVQLIAKTNIETDGEVTVSAKKLADITKALPAQAEIRFQYDGDGKAVLKSGRSRFTLQTLVASDFPVMPEVTGRSLVLPKPTIAKVIEKTHFAMAQMDVRYYLNGLMMQTDGNGVRAVATNGHRLALFESANVKEDETKIIIPRKGVSEILKLSDGDGEIRIKFGTTMLTATADGVALTTKLIDGRFPEYQRVMPQHSPIRVVAPKAALVSSIQRASLLSNEKYRGLKIDVSNSRLVISASNANQDEAEEEIEVEHTGGALQVGFNAEYLKDAVAAVDGDSVEMLFTDANTSCLIRDSGGATYVVMPMRI